MHAQFHILVTCATVIIKALAFPSLHLAANIVLAKPRTAGRVANVYVVEMDFSNVPAITFVPCARSDETCVQGKTGFALGCGYIPRDSSV